MQSSSENRKCGQKEATAKTMEICCEAGFGHYYIVTVFENYRKSSERSLRSNSVTRQLTFNRTKICGKMK